MLEVKNASFGYKNNRLILQHINLELSGGQVLAVLGPNGVGKTTLLKCMMNIQTWTGGECLLNKVQVSRIPVSQLWRTIAYVPQAKNTAFSYTSEEMILMGRSAHIGLFSQPGKKEMAMAEEIMELLGIGHLRGKLCNQMSGGELQMVLIGRALIANPQILILDEPESNLDFKNQLVVLETIRDLARNKGIACLFNTHYPSHALKISTHALILDRTEHSVYGESQAVITEQNLRRSFDVAVHIHEVAVGAERYQSVIPLEIVQPSSPRS
jgi:iron complex transport system ATP-binding protein